MRGDLLHLRPLAEHGRLVHAVRDEQPLRVVGDADVFVAARRRADGHRRERIRAVGPGRVHLEVTAVRADPFGMSLERCPRVRECEETCAHRRCHGRIDVGGEPLLDEPGDPGPDEAELGELASALADRRGLLVPLPERRARSATQGALTMRCLFL